MQIGNFKSVIENKIYKFNCIEKAKLWLNLCFEVCLITLYVCRSVFIPRLIFKVH